MTYEAFGLDDEEVPAASFAEGAEPEPAQATELENAGTDVVEELSPEPELGDPSEEGDGGFSDEDRMVRVWLTDGRLTKVRLSSVWFTRMRPGDTLQNHFREALTLALLDRAAVESAREPAPVVTQMEELASLPAEVRDAFEGLGPLSDELLEAVSAASDDLQHRVDEQSATQQQAASEIKRFVGKSQGITVHVDQWGNTYDVSFEERWLDQAQVGSIVTHLQRAADRAHDSYVPIPPDETMGALLEESRLLSLVLTAVLNPRKDT